jgi:ferredoxin
MEKTRFVSFLREHNQQTWNELLDNLVPSIHPVDQAATRIWFGFWPLELREALAELQGPEEMARIMDLEGKWRLEEQIDSAVDFLYGSKYWAVVKKAVLEHAASYQQPEGKNLEQRIRKVASGVAAREKAEESILLGITAVAFMILQQVGMDALAAVVEIPAPGKWQSLSAEQVVRRREKKSRDGLFGFLKGLGRRYRVVWDESKRNAFFRARHGQDLAMAAATDTRDYRAMDYRCIDGPIPVECRVASCGYCWVGVITGNRKMSAISDFEKERLHYFGYDSVNGTDDRQPLIRLACQTQCLGDVTLVTPRWNGELKRRHNKSPEDLGTV